MDHRVRLCSLVGALLICGLVSPAADPTPEELARDLGHPAYSRREKASRELYKFGEKAIPALKTALKSEDREVRDRAGKILSRFEWGVFPDTPPDVLKQINAFRTNQLEQQTQAVTALVKMGRVALPSLRAVLSKADSLNRSRVFDSLTTTLRSEVPLLLFSKKFDDAEELLALNALGTSQSGMLDYTVFLRMRGHLPDAIRVQEAIRDAGGPGATSAKLMLLFLYHADGRGDRAKKIASSLEDRIDPELPVARTLPYQNLYLSLLEDLGDWSELAKQPITQANSDAGLRIFRLRLAGDQKTAEELLDVEKRTESDEAELQNSGRTVTVDSATLALMANGRPLDGIARLRVNHTAPHILADMLSARMEFTEALGLLSGSKRLDDASGLDVENLRLLYGTRRGRLLAQLGQRDAAAQIFNQVAEKIPAGNLYGITQLVRYEVRSGRSDLACEHLGNYLAAVQRNEGRFFGNTYGQDPFEVLFERDGDLAKFWWEVLLKNKPEAEAPGRTMRRVRDLLRGEAKPADLDEAMKAVAKPRAENQTFDEATQSQAVAAVWRANGEPGKALDELLRRAKAIGRPTDSHGQTNGNSGLRRNRGWVFGTDESFLFWVDLADQLQSQGRHAEAAERLEQGRQWYPENPILLWLSGRALMKAGDTVEGKRRMELAHWVALGNPRLHGRFLEELLDRGAAESVIRRERDLTRNAGWVGALYLGNVWNQVARASLAIKDFPSAVDAHRRAIHYLLRTPSVTYVEGYAYLTVPQSVQANTARALLAQGKFEEGLATLREALTVLPGNSELVIATRPVLMQAGRTREADELFATAWAKYNEVLKDHPGSAWAMSSAAWLAAGCRRDLDTALKYAEKSIELDPNIRGYRETLAEVHFRRGDREKSTAIMKDLVTNNRHNHHYEQQLERYRSASFDSPLPNLDD